MNKALFFGLIVALLSLLAPFVNAGTLVIRSDALGERSVAIPGIEGMGQLSIAMHAAQFAASPDGWDLPTAVLQSTGPPEWSATWWCLCDIPASDSEDFGYDLNAEAEMYGNSRTLIFHTDDVPARGAHDICEPQPFGVISGLGSGAWSQCFVPDWGEFFVEGVPPNPENPDSCNGVTNVALNRPATGSSRPGDAYRLTDGLIDIWWGSGWWPPAWCEIDLEEEVVLSCARLLTEQTPNGNSVHEITGRRENGEEVHLATLASYTTDEEWLEVGFLVHTPVRWVRVTTTASPSWVAWREIELYVEQPTPTENITWGKLKRQLEE